MLVSLKKAVDKQLLQTNRIYLIEYKDVLNAIAVKNEVTFEGRTLDPNTHLLSLHLCMNIIFIKSKIFIATEITYI